MSINAHLVNSYSKTSAINAHTGVKTAPPLINVRLAFLIRPWSMALALTIFLNLISNFSAPRVPEIIVFMLPLDA